jgi:hypothetical protein
MRVFGTGTLARSHCGSAGLYPHASLFGELGGVLGCMRYACSDCRRRSWLRPDAEVPPAPPGEPGLEAPSPPNVPASLDALDMDARPLPPCRADLSALDEELTRQRRKRKPSSRPRAARG